jgi:hypothetical protein
LRDVLEPISIGSAGFSLASLYHCSSHIQPCIQYSQSPSGVSVTRVTDLRHPQKKQEAALRKPLLLVPAGYGRLKPGFAIPGCGKIGVPV